ncbi:hypothetical protein ACFQGE_09675 [Halomicroarcula sp. GCM10025817]|uniref:hypothetical protein n=1 Tax=Haloarcula TaxID=2237 RepID=UPI0023E8DA11|nr:hypothetical protein [Halomicroarcula sp. SYNS111]
MSIDTSLHALARLVEAQRAEGVGVESVSATTEGEALSTTMRVALPFDLSAGAEHVEVADAEYRDGRVCVDVSMTFDTAELPELAPETPATTDSSAGGERAADGPPAYKDPDRLREVYERYDSFAAMTEALDVDVTAQTVRRNMMKHGIHEPNTSSNETADGGAGASDESADDVASASDGQDTHSQDGHAETTPLATADEEPPEFGGVDLPEGVTPETVRDAVAESSSLHGVQLALDLEMRETRQLLQDLGVLTYVTGRLSDHEDKPDPSEIEQQIYDSLAAHADGGDSRE